MLEEPHSDHRSVAVPLHALLLQGSSTVRSILCTISLSFGLLIVCRAYVVQIVKKVDLEAQRGPSRQNQRRKRNPIDDLRREVSIMRTLRHKNIVSLQVRAPGPKPVSPALLPSAHVT